MAIWRQAKGEDAVRTNNNRLAMRVAPRSAGLRFAAWVIALPLTTFELRISPPDAGRRDRFGRRRREIGAGQGDAEAAAVRRADSDCFMDAATSSILGRRPRRSGPPPARVQPPTERPRLPFGTGPLFSIIVLEQPEAVLPGQLAADGLVRRHQQGALRGERRRQGRTGASLEA